MSEKETGKRVINLKGKGKITAKVVTLTFKGNDPIVNGAEELSIEQLKNVERRFREMRIKKSSEPLTP